MATDIPVQCKVWKHPSLKKPVYFFVCNGKVIRYYNRYSGGCENISIRSSDGNVFTVNLRMEIWVDVGDHLSVLCVGPSPDRGEAIAMVNQSQGGGTPYLAHFAGADYDYLRKIGTFEKAGFFQDSTAVMQGFNVHARKCMEFLL